MRARYLGDHSNMTSWGINFPRGVFVRIDNEAAKRKIPNNSHFEVENSDAEDVVFVEEVKEVQKQAYSGARRGPKPKQE